MVNWIQHPSSFVLDCCRYRPVAVGKIVSEKLWRVDLEHHLKWSPLDPVSFLFVFAGYYKQINSYALIHFSFILFLAEHFVSLLKF